MVPSRQDIIYIGTTNNAGKYCLLIYPGLIWKTGRHNMTLLIYDIVHAILLLIFDTRPVCSSDTAQALCL